MGSRITQLIPTARTLTVGGREFQVREARLSDLAALQAWVDSKTPDPLDGVWDDAHDPEKADARRDRALYDALGSAGDGPPEYASDEGRRLLCTPEGVGVFLFLALGRGNPDLTLADVADVAGAMTGREYAAVRRAFYGVDPLREIERILTDHVPRAEGGRSVSWGEAVDEVARCYHWTYQYVYSLTLTEFRNARSAGKPEDGPRVGWAAAGEANRLMADRRGRAYAESTDAPGEGTTCGRTPSHPGPGRPGTEPGHACHPGSATPNPGTPPG